MRETNTVPPRTRVAQPSALRQWAISIGASGTMAAPLTPLVKHRLMRLLEHRLSLLKEAPIQFWDFRTNPDNLNIVLFSGARLVQRITSIKIGTDEAMANPHFGMTSEGIDRFFKFSNDYQEERDRFTSSKPFYYEE